MLKKNYKILEVFVKNPTITYLFQEVKGYTDSKSESYTYNSLKYFVKEGVLDKSIRGGISIYKIAKNSKAISFLSIAAEYNTWNKKNLPFDNIKELVSKLNIAYFTFLVTGSYAKETQTAKSDLDVVLIVPKDSTKIFNNLRHFCEMSIPSIHLYVFTDKEFLDMLLDVKANYGKEIVKNNLLIYGAGAYYKIIFEAMKNGFTY